MPGLPSQISAALAALVRGDADAVARIDAHPSDLVVAVAEHEGLAPLAAHRFASSPTPPDVSVQLSVHARRNALADVIRQQSLVQLLRAFDEANVAALIFKGEQLAHLCYERPDLRPRLDTDILVRPRERGRAAEVLTAAGYHAAPQLEADLISYQTAFVKSSESGERHVVDLHWRVSNPQQFGGSLDVEELFAGAVPIATLGSSARGLGAVHALLLSVVHPVAHHPGRQRLLWDLDTARLCRELSPATWPQFVELARARGLGGVCHERLSRAIDLFKAPVPNEVMSSFAGCVTRRPSNQAAAVVAGVLALPRWSDRIALMRQHLVPSRDYMRQVYAPASRSPLGVLYMQRAVLGFWKYCRRSY